MYNQHARTFPKEQLLDCIHQLATRYPACFFEDPRLRRPLKSTIISDLQKEGASDLVFAGVNYYTRNWTYQNCLQAGAERVDLDGKKAGIVTEQEQLNAQKRVREEKQALSGDAISVVRSLHAAGKIPDDQLSKITAPPRPKSSPLLARLQTLLGSADSLLAGSNDEVLGSVLAIAALNLLVSEAKKVIASLSTDEAKLTATEEVS